MGRVYISIKYDLFRDLFLGNSERGKMKTNAMVKDR